jgi:hypothetical protein
MVDGLLHCQPTSYRLSFILRMHVVGGHYDSGQDAAGRVYAAL